MMWRKQETAEEAGGSIVERIASEAEGFYHSGKMNCAESVLMAVRNAMAPEVPEEVVQMAGGFGTGSGSGCLCGNVSGGTMAFGLVINGDRKRVSALTKELHRWFKEEYGATCCKLILQKHGKICVKLTGRVAGKVAEMLETQAP